MHSFTLRPTRLPGMLLRWRRSRVLVRRLLQQQHHAAAMVATGGFVSVPAVAAAVAGQIPTLLVNLDAVPGKANRLAARGPVMRFSAFDLDPALGWQYERIGLPLRRVAIGPDDQAEARRKLGLDPDTPTLLIVGGSQGAASLNQLAAELLRRPGFREAITAWQVLHLTGAGQDTAMASMWHDARVTAVVQPFCHTMGLAWRAADLAITRAGAGSVAEAWVNATPCAFFPYPGHADQHQRLNAQPMVDVGGAVLCMDAADPVANADAHEPALTTLLTDGPRRAAMQQALARSQPADGAHAIAVTLRNLLTSTAQPR